MDWVRRNFPDILIGIALILVVAAIVVTLLNGGSLFPRGRQASNTPSVNPGLPTPSTSNPVVRTTPNTTPPPSISSSVTSSDGENSTLINPVPPITTTDTPAIENDTPETAISNPTGIEVVPPSGTTASSTVTAAVTVPDTDNSDTTTNINTNLPTEPYRIGVGAFRNRENADRLADEVRASGYPVFIANQDDLNIVLVGPYTVESEAAQVATRLRNEGRDVTIYEFRPSEEELLSSSQSTTTSTSTPATTSTNGGSFIQVGAYGSVASSLPQVERLEGLGYTVETVQSGSLYRLLIGPYADSSLEQVQAQLTSQGIDHFVTSGP